MILFIILHWLRFGFNIINWWRELQNYASWILGLSLLSLYIVKKESCNITCSLILKMDPTLYFAFSSPNNCIQKGNMQVEHGSFCLFAITYNNFPTWSKERTGKTRKLRGPKKYTKSIRIQNCTRESCKTMPPHYQTVKTWKAQKVHQKFQNWQVCKRVLRNYASSSTNCQNFDKYIEKTQ